MAVTVSYDLSAVPAQQRNYIRSMFERFGWKRLGGSVFRYSGRKINGRVTEDWLNDVIPSLMFFRSYVLKNQIDLKFFTLDSASVCFLDFSDPALTLGRMPQDGPGLTLSTPTNTQSAASKLREFVDDAIASTP